MTITGIGTRNPSNQTASDPRLNQHSHWDVLLTDIILDILIFYWTVIERI